ncbi:MAG: hypothetical protein SNJ72_05430 [Fimbriimonadales bacterium]
MELATGALNSWLTRVREGLLNNGTTEPSLWETAQSIRMLSEGWDALEPEVRTHFERALSSAQRVDDLLDSLSQHAKTLARASVKASAPRYPTWRDVALAYERLALVPSDADPERIERALVASTLVEPNTSVPQRAQHLLSALVALQPFREYNLSSALIVALAFAQANGATNLPEPSQLAQAIHDSDGMPELAPLLGDATGTPDPRTYADLIEALVPRYRDALMRTENALQERSLVRLSQLPDTVRTSLQPTPGPSFEWRYLTLQDLIWINSEVMRSPQHYAYDRLEEATYYQYSYRQSRDVPLQAARFLWGYLKYRPFAQGNLQTALIAVLAFLEINGYEVHLPVEQAADWIRAVAERRRHPQDAIRQIAVPHQPGKRPIPLRDLVHHLIEHYEPALESLNHVPTH